MRMHGATICGMSAKPERVDRSIITYANDFPNRQVRDELNHEALQFVKEQRIRCLLQGAWFPHAMNYSTDAGPITSKTVSRTVPSAWRFVRLSHNRRHLHYADFEERTEVEPRLDVLQEKSTSQSLSLASQQMGI